MNAICSRSEVANDIISGDADAETFKEHVFINLCIARSAVFEKIEIRYLFSALATLYLRRPQFTTLAESARASVRYFRKSFRDGGCGRYRHSLKRKRFGVSLKLIEARLSVRSQISRKNIIVFDETWKRNRCLLIWGCQEDCPEKRTGVSKTSGSCWSIRICMERTKGETIRRSEMTRRCTVAKQWT